MSFFKLFCRSECLFNDTAADYVLKFCSYKGNVFGVEPPTFVELEVVDTEPGFAGNTSTNATKPATLETGATIQVPLFVDMNEVIRVDTRTGEYMERVK